MRANRWRIKSGFRGGLLALVLMGAAMTGLSLSGCGEVDDPNVNGPVSTGQTIDSDYLMSPPLLSEVASEVDMQVNQSLLMDGALEEWRTAMTSGGGPRFGGGRPGSRPGGGRPGGGVRPGGHGHGHIMQFLVRSAEFLDTEQLADLISLLIERQRAHLIDRPHLLDHGPGNHGSGGRLERLVEELSLSEEQAEQLQAVFTAHHEARRELREQFAAGELTEEEFRAGMNELRDQLDLQVQDILTAEQYDDLQALRIARFLERWDRRQEMADEHGSRRLEFLSRILELSAEQSEQVAAIREEGAEQAAALVESLRNGEITLDDTRAGLRQIREESIATIRDLLTPAQQELLDVLGELRALMRHRGPRH